MLRRSIIASALIALAAALTPALADQPAGRSPALLEMSGAITVPEGSRSVRLDRRALEGMDPVELRTTTMWTEGPQLFRGVPLPRLLQAVGARGTKLKATALDEFQSVLDLDDPAAALAIIAFEQNGAPMRIRDKGPLWIVFPWSAHPELAQSEKTRSWSVWQLARLEVIAN